MSVDAEEGTAISHAWLASSSMADFELTTRPPTTTPSPSKKYIVRLVAAPPSAGGRDADEPGFAVRK